MEKLARQLSQARWLPPVVTLLTLGILGATIFFGSLELRRNIRDQIIGRDAEVLDAVAMAEQLGADSTADLNRRLEDSAGQLELAFRLSRLREGVIAVRLFDKRGELVTGVPANVRSTRLSGELLGQMHTLVPRSRFEPAAELREVFHLTSLATAQTNRLPLLSVLIPIHAPQQTNLLAVAELIQDGASIREQLRRLDRQLLRQAVFAFFLAGGMAGAALMWAFIRLQKLNHTLQRQATSLRHANQELALTAKTSALGAVTAHVIHGLTSPLNGLHNFVRSHAGGDDEWRDAVDNTRRMQALVGEVVRVLGEQTQGTEYELPLTEMAEVLAGRVRPAAESAGVRYQQQVAASDTLSNRTANLVLLILENLVQNAIQATPRGKSVTLSITQNREEVRCEVADEGNGLPAALRDSLFVPCRSTKSSGNGLGLALSQHLARHLGADLQLVTTSGAGTTFALVLAREHLGTGAVAAPAAAAL